MATPTMRLYATFDGNTIRAEEIHQTRLNIEQCHNTLKLNEFVHLLAYVSSATDGILKAVSANGAYRPSLPKDLSGKVIDSKTVANELQTLSNDLERIRKIA